ncbi:hypothetical protein MMC18_008573 [Xylographa bjoerkii]|nr:hypothetical protein [Xylographa bjoerkii]
MVLSDANKELDTVASTAVTQRSDLDVTEWEPKRLSDARASEGIVVRLDEANILKSGAPAPLSLIQGSEVKVFDNEYPEAHSGASDNSNLILLDSLTEKGDPVRKCNVLQIESEDKEAQLNRYLFHPQNTGQEDLSIFPVRTHLPGESSFSLETGEPARAPSRRPLSPASRAETAYTRKQGACDECRILKRKCLHRLQERASPADGVEIIQGDMSIANARKRVAFDYPIRRRRPKIDNSATSEHAVSQNARSTTPCRKTSSIQNGTRRTCRLPRPSISRTRDNQGRTSTLAATPSFEGSGPERSLLSTPVGPNFSWEEMPEYQIVMTGELSRNPLVVPSNESNGTPETDQSAASQALGTQTLTNPYQTGPSSSVLASSSEQHAVSSWDMESLQVRQSHTTTDNQVTQDSDYPHMQSAFTQSNPVILPRYAVSTAIETQQKSRGTPEVELMEPYGPRNLNLYGDFPWLDNGGTEKSPEMDMDFNWDDNLMFPSDSVFSVLESAESTSGSGFTPPSDDSSRDPTTQ